VGAVKGILSRFYFCVDRSDIRQIFGPMPAEVTKVREVNKFVVINKLYDGKAIHLDFVSLLLQ